MDFGRLALQGSEVLLRPLESTDARPLADAAAESREHYGFTTVPDAYAEAQRYIEVALEARVKDQRYPFAILWNTRLVGSTSYADFRHWTWPPGCELQRTDRPDAVEIGHTWLAASAQRTRCNTEAKYLLLQHAFETWRVHRVTLRTDERNQRSRRAIERLGATLDGIIRADKPAIDCSVRNSAHYSIVAAEWAEVKARLEGLLRPARA